MTLRPDEMAVGIAIVFIVGFVIGAVTMGIAFMRDPGDPK